MADVGNEAAAAAGDNGQAPNQPEQRPPPAARRAPPVNRGAEGNAGGGGGSRDPLINMRDRLFHTLFYRLTLAYARACPKSVRRIVETMVLLKVRFHSSCQPPPALTLFQSVQAILCFFMLVYIHVKFTRNPVHCLEGVKDTWPRDGILRVEIMRDAPDDYNVERSYEKERHIQMRNRAPDELSLLFAALSWDQK